MLEIKDEPYLLRVKEFAKTRGKLEQLEEKLSYLDTYAEGSGEDQVRGKTKCLLFPERNSDTNFDFRMMKQTAAGDYVYWFNGGLIYYAAGDTGVGEPQYSVRLDTGSEGWEIHT